MYLDGKYAFGLALMHALWLHVGQQVSDDEIAELQAADTLEKAKQRALGLISYRPRSVAEVQRRLKRAGVDAAMIDKVVDDLRAAGLLDDESFSKAWVESRLGASPRSSRMIAWELRQKGVAESAVETALADVNDEDSAYRLALKRWPRVAKLPERQERRRKLGEYLARNGYGYDTIQETISRIEQENNAGSAADEDLDYGVEQE